MNRTLNRLAARRESLVAQAAAQRNALAQNVAPWRAPLALADRSVEAIRALRRHPALLLGTALVFVAWRPQRVGKWPRMLWAGWRIGRRMFRN
ncbi:MAG: YqjK-like family protein [Hydrogenophilales bacterium]|nr:YqjK-like family protein [Hydrogenophilales bacterium]